MEGNTIRKRMNRFLGIGVGIFIFFSTQGQTRSLKRGMSYNIPTPEDIQVLIPGMSWYYNWGTEPFSDVLNSVKESGLEYVPMAWNGNFNRENIRSYIQSNPQVKYLLGFNEPNFLEQARMTPTEAAERWSELEALANELGLKLVSPAVNYAPGNGAVGENGVTYTDPVKYLDDFFKACPECQVDYIAVHSYVSNVGSLKSYINQFKKYGKPIWLTEFCAGEGNVTDLSQKNYMVEAINYLETDPDVFRYAWFIGRGNGGGFPYMQLLGKKEGELTEKGEIFVNMSSYDDDFYFAVPGMIEAEHYIRTSEGTHLEKTTDTTGTLNLSDFLETRWAEYNVDVPEAGEYDLGFRVASRYASALSVSVDGNVLANKTIDITGGLDQWQTQTCRIPLSAGKQKIRIDITKGRVNLNWWTIAGAGSGLEAAAIPLARIWPNPVKDILYVETGGVKAEFIMRDFQGREVMLGTTGQPLHVSGLPDGIYVLSVKNGNRIADYKVVKIN